MIETSYIIITIIIIIIITIIVHRHQQGPILLCAVKTMERIIATKRITTNQLTIMCNVRCHQYCENNHCVASNDALMFAAMIFIVNGEINVIGCFTTVGLQCIRLGGVQK
jgi:hypothetical protein